MHPSCTRRSRICLALLTALLPGLAAAVETAPATTVAQDELETVVVYARRVTPVTRVAATVTVVDAERIAATLARDIRDVVRYEPGLTVRNDPFRFGLDTISIRGLGGNRVAVEVDGIPAAGGFALGSYSDSGRAFLDPALVRRIEFLRGPASSLYGSEAIAGVVAMTSLAPADLLGEDDVFGASTEAGVDSQDDGWHAALRLAGRAGPGDWLLGYVRREGGEVDTAADVEPNPRDYASDALLAKYVLPDVAGGPLTFTVEGGQTEQQSEVLAFLGVGRFLNTTRLEGDDQLRRARAGVEHLIESDVAAFDSAEWRVYWQSTETDQDTYEERRAVPPRTPATILEREFQYDERIWGAELTAAKALGSGTVAHELVYGFEATLTRIEEMRNGQQTSLPSGDISNTILGETFPLRDLPISDVTEVGVFLQDEIGPRDGRWTVVPALRVDHYDLDPDPDSVYREDNPATQVVGVTETSLAPKLGATYRLSEPLTAFFQYARGFRSPPPEDVNIGLEIPLFGYRALPNPDLKPETSDGFELGLRGSTPSTQWTLSTFLTDYDDMIESRVNLGRDPSGVTLFQSRNVARARIYGAEFASRFDFAEAFPQVDGLSARVAASWTRGEDLDRDEPLNSLDPPSLVAGLRYDAASGRWGVEGVVTAVEAKTDVDDSTADLYRTDGYATVDLLAEWRFSPQLRVNLGLFNLTDTEYTEWGDVRGRTTDDVLVPYYTQPGFNASATLHYDF